MSDAGTIICRPWITKNGRRIYAKTYGLKAFCFKVREDYEPEAKKDKNKEATSDQEVAVEE